MARRSQCSSAGDNPSDPNYLPPHYREEYRSAIDASVEDSLEGYYQCLQNVDVVDFSSQTEIQYIQSVVQPPKQSLHAEQQFSDSEGEGSSDTYWPIHSDSDVPGSDLGWPQVHHFIEPTEVTTSVNPPEPDMPSIKEQARRSIKNAQQVIAIVMDVFTDVDIFADILNAAGRRVAVYISSDEHNAAHFFNMVVNCRVNSQAFPFIRVRTVSGITYQCRSGKTFKGQMMDRFSLTDCRAVSSGNYSLMWSFEKSHRCMAHSFLGQLVTTFDEEFRILFAQSQPSNVESMLAQIEDLNVLQKRQFPNENTSSYREPKRFSPMDIPSDDWGGNSYDEQIEGNLRITASKRQGPLRGPAEMYHRYTSQQPPRMDPGFDQGHSRVSMTDNPALKRHSYAEDVPGRYSFPFLPQQGVPDPESRGKIFHRGQQPLPGQGPEEDIMYDKFWNQGYLTEQYPVPGLQQEAHPAEFDPVFNYLSSTRNIDFDQGSDRLPPPADLPITSSHPKRSGVGHPYACQTSPTPSSNSADQKPFFHDPTMNRKDPTVKQKSRNWRIGSYLSTYDNPEEEGMPMGATQPADPFEQTSNPIQQTAPGADLPVSKIPNVKEFKVTAVPRVSHMPMYAKAATQEKPKKVSDEPAPVAAETKTAPTPSETSAIAEEKKHEEDDQKQPKHSVLLRDDSFRRKYNAAVSRSSRLRSSSIFSSSEPQTSQETEDQDDEEGDKDKTEQTKPSLGLGQWRSSVREPIEWSRYIKSNSETVKPDDVSKKDEDKDSTKGKDSQDLTETPEEKEAVKITDGEQDSVTSSVPGAKVPEAEAHKSDHPVQPTKPLPSYVDMNDPDNRLMFFKKSAAQRKAAKAAEAQKEKDKGELKPQPELKGTSVYQKEEPPSKGTPETSVGKDFVKKPVVESKNTIEKDPKTNEQKTQPKKAELDSQSVASLSVDEHPTKPPKEPVSSSVLGKESLSPLMPRCKPTTAESPKTDQPLQSSNPSLTSTSFVDMSDPDSRLMFFKESAAKRKATKKGEEKVQMKPQADLKNTSVYQKEEDPLKGAPQSVTPSITAVSSGKSTTTSTETLDSASPSLQDGEHTRKQDSLVKKGPSTRNTFEEQAAKVCAESGETGLERHPAEKTEASQSKSPENPAALEASEENSSPKQAKTVSSTAEDADKREGLNLESVSDIPSSVEVSSSSHPQIPELVQPETNICPLPLPSGAETTPKIGLSEPPVQISTSDTPPLDSGLENPLVAAEETSVYDYAQEVYSSVNDTSTVSQNVDEIKFQESVSSSQQESSELSPEALQNSDSQPDQTHQDAVQQPASLGGTLSADAANVESDVSHSETDKLHSPAETNTEESSAPTSSVEGVEKNVTDLGKEGSVACKALEEAKAESTSPAFYPSLPDPGMLSESGPEDSVSKPDSKNETKLEDVPSETRSLESTEPCNASSLDKMEPPQDTPAQTTPSSDLTPTDLNASSTAETLSSSSSSDPDKSALDPANEKSETSVSAVANLPDVNSKSSEIQPESEESLVQPTAQSSSSPNEPTTVAPAEADLQCKTSEEYAPKSQPVALQCQNIPDVNSISSETQPESEESLVQPTAQSSSSPNEPTTVAPAEADLQCETSQEVTTKSQPVASQCQNVPDMHLISSETQPESEKSVVEPTSQLSRSPNEPTTVTPTEADLPCKTSEEVTTKSQTPEPPAPQESSKKEAELSETDEKKSSNLEDKDKSQKTTTGESKSREKTKDQSKQSNSSEITEVTSKQPKSSQSRYHSSTVNVSSSSNSRDDTKSSSEQISAQSQSRNEATKASPVTDDEKEDKADKNAKNEKELGYRTFNRGQTKSPQDREKSSEKIQSMRKERKVYSRFEMAP